MVDLDKTYIVAARDNKDEKSEMYPAIESIRVIRLPRSLNGRYSNRY